MRILGCRTRGASADQPVRRGGAQPVRLDNCAHSYLFSKDARIPKKTPQIPRSFLRRSHVSRHKSCRSRCLPQFGRAAVFLSGHTTTAKPAEGLSCARGTRRRMARWAGCLARWCWRRLREQWRSGKGTGTFRLQATRSSGPTTRGIGAARERDVAFGEVAAISLFGGCLARGSPYRSSFGGQKN